MPRRFYPLLASCLLLGACSENLGPAPPDGGSVVAVLRESVAGPRTDRVGTQLAVAGGAVFVGSDAGLFHFVHDAPSDWSPAHGGYITPDLSERAGGVRELTAADAGRRVFFRGAVAGLDALVVSEDGGRFFARLDRPDALLVTVDAISIAPPGAWGASGAWIAVQGARAFVRAIGDEAWQARLMPRAPLAVVGVCADAEGRLAVAVETGVPAAWTVWAAADESAELSATGLTPDSAILDIAFRQGGICVATASGIELADVAWVSWPGVTVLIAALEAFSGEVGWALVGRRGDGSLALATGFGPAVVSAAVALPRDDVVDVSGSGGDARVLFADGSSFAGNGPVDPWMGVEIDLSAAAVDGSVLAVGHFRSGEIYTGPVGDPEGFASLGAPLRASTPREILYGPAPGGGLYVASFGVYRTDPPSPVWSDRNNGFFSYDPGFFGGPFPVSALATLDDGRQFWAGGINGEGPYRSLDGGLSWARVHDGLGEPGSYLAEAGLPLVSQVQAFASDATGQTWMAGFRGGAFWLEASTDRWQQLSAGLPMVDGSTLDSCCPVPGESEVDLRDLLRTGDGSLLAATGWGIYRLPAGASRWELRSTGLFNLDVQQLLRHPDDSATVVAATRGRAESPDWLFLTRDSGRTWFPVRGRLDGRNPIELVWSDPSRLEIIALLEAQGAWRMELKP
ncbi:hypothetical protein DRQ32_03015 [bacterium]|nr:MAG: hypothetical protein DRQ32_03015 [bacterium]